MANELENTSMYLLIVEHQQSIPQYLQAPFPVVKTLLPMQEAWVPSLACDQGTKICVLHSVAKQTNKKLWLNQVGFKTGFCSPYLCGQGATDQGQTLGHSGCL